MALRDYDYPPEEFPPLPDGLFCDVRESRFMHWHELQLRCKRLIGSTKVGWWVIKGGMAGKDGSVAELRRWLRFATSQPEIINACREVDAINQHRKGAKA